MWAYCRRMGAWKISSVLLVTVVLGILLALSPSASAVLEREDTIRQNVQHLVSAYESRQPDHVLKLISSRFSHPLGLETALRDEYDAYHSIEILSRVGSVVTGEDSASARVKWYRKRIDRRTGKQENKEGEVTLFFSLEGGVNKLIGQEGESFLPVSRQREKGSGVR